MKDMKIRLIGIILIMIATVLLWSFIDYLPIIGDPDSAPNTHVSRVYIANAPTQTNSPNLVTAVLADYRGLDTMLETTVIYLASVAVILIMSGKKSKSELEMEHGERTAYEAIRNFGTQEIWTVLPILIPILLLYAIYVLMHGEVSLGGGFQAGALIAMSYILYSLVEEEYERKLKLSQFSLMCIGAVGLLIYFSTGLLPMLTGGNFLEYGALPFPFMDEPERHSTGILMIEIGVTITVASSIITILNAILERKR